MDVKHLEYVEMTLKAADIEIASVNEMNLISSGSEIRVEKVYRLNMDSRNDQISIDSLISAYGRGSFTKMAVRNVQMETNMDLNYGTLRVAQVGNDFSRIKINSKSTDINLFFDQSAYFFTNLVAKADRIKLPKSDTSLEYTQEEDKYISVIGTIGKQKPKKGTVNIEAENGDLVLNFINP